MTRKQIRFSVRAGAAALTVLSSLLLTRTGLAVDDTTTVSALAAKTHFHGLAVDIADSNRLYLATHHGLYAVGLDGKARRVSEATNDFMGFTPHPSDPTILFSSGHPSSGGNLGFLLSRDAGRSWTKLSDGVDGPVDFHQMDVSKVDPNVIWGVYQGLQRSADGGRNWTRIGPAPEGIIDIAASSRDTNTLYAATQRGLLRSNDGGRSWHAAHPSARPATLVHVARDGDVFAFIVGLGLVRAAELDLGWQSVSGEFADTYLIHLDVDPKASGRIVAVQFDPKTRTQSVIVSADARRTWRALGSP